LAVAYTDHLISGIIIESMLYDHETYKLTGEYFYVAYEEMSMSALGFDVPQYEDI
jgi:hypothetical protein